ncbi:MAG: HTH domain-containing protein [Cyanobacteria bacterium P01_H01_bin.121]
MAKTTVAQAVVEVLQKSKRPMALAEITDAIAKKSLYEFNAKDPKAIVRSAIVRRCEGTSRKDAIMPSLFKQTVSGQFELLS